MAYHRRIIFSMILFALLIGLISCVQKEQQLDDESLEKTQLHILAPASFFDIMMEVKDMYEEHHNVELLFQFGGTGELVQKITEGKQADLFISGSTEWMEYVLEKDKVVDNTVTFLTSNRLVLIAQKSGSVEVESLDDLKNKYTELDSIVMADLNTSSGGKYAQSALKAIGEWDEMQGHILFTQNVRQVVTEVELNPNYVGFVYQSDALKSNDISVIEVIDEKLHDAIIYESAILQQSEHEEEAQQFLDFLKSNEMEILFEEYEFSACE